MNQPPIPKAGWGERDIREVLGTLPPLPSLLPFPPVLYAPPWGWKGHSDATRETSWWGPKGTKALIGGPSYLSS